MSALKFKNVIHKSNNNQSKVMSRLVCDHPKLLEVENSPGIKPIHRHRSYNVLLKLVKQSEIIQSNSFHIRRSTLSQQVKSQRPLVAYQKENGGFFIKKFSTGVDDGKITELSEYSELEIDSNHEQ